MAENKLAAILLLQEHGLDHLVPDRHLDEIAGWSRAPVLGDVGRPPWRS